MEILKVAIEIVIAAIIMTVIRVILFKDRKER